MKTKVLKTAMIISAFIMLAFMPLKNVKAQQGGVTFQVFYDNLAPYGQWIDDPQYGYVWAPTVQDGFRPYYSNGHWVMTEYGNMWVSGYDWGWAPFHYGRWTFDNYYGWIWIPDTEWGPAWVSWRTGPEYYGWAPLGPGISVDISFNNYYPPDNWWVFIPPAYIHHHHWHDHHYGYNYNTTIIHNTTIVNNYYDNDHRKYIFGPRSDEVRKFTHKDVTVYKVQDGSKPGLTEVKNNDIQIYRPAVGKPAGKVTPTDFTKTEHPIGQPQPVGERGIKPRNDHQNTSPPSKTGPGQKDNGDQNYKNPAPKQNPVINHRQQDNKPPQIQEKKPDVKPQQNQQQRKPEMKPQQNQQQRKPEIKPENRKNGSGTKAPVKNNPQLKREPQKKSEGNPGTR